MKKVTIYFVLVTLISLFLLPVVFSYRIASDLSYYRRHNPTLTSFMHYRIEQNKLNGCELKTEYSFVPLEKISPYLRSAVIYAEDCNFYKHHGIDFGALENSIEVNQHRGRIIFGGSTITMQLCKNLFLTPKKTYTRKLTEMALAWRLENAMPKSRILELYLNVIEYGDGIFGAQNAAWYYFNKDADQLTPDEAASLASLLTSPLRYENPKYQKQFTERKQRILNYLLTGQNV